MKDGTNLVNGKQVSLDEIQIGLKDAWNDRRADVIVMLLSFVFK